MNSASKHPRVREFLEQLRVLYAEIGSWLPHDLSARRGTIHLHEEAFGQYDAPTLVITGPDGLTRAKLEPVGASIIGAKARVDLRGSSDTQPILYLLKGGPTLTAAVTHSAGSSADRSEAPVFQGVTVEGWYWIDDKRPRHAHVLDRNAFLKLLRVVGDYYGEAQPA